MNKFFNIILTSIIFLTYINITNAYKIEIVPVNSEAKSTIIQNNISEKKYVGMLYDSEILSVTIDDKKYKMVKNHMGNMKYMESGYEYYFTGEYFDTREYNLYVEKKGSLYIEKHTGESQLNKLDSKVFGDLIVKTVLADEMLGSENLLIGENLIKLNTQIKDINYNEDSRELYIVTSGYFGAEIAVYLYKIDLLNVIGSVKFENAGKIEKISKNREIKALLIAKYNVSKLEKGNQYLKLIDNISDEKLINLEKKFVVILDKFNVKTYLTKDEKKIDIIIKYAYDKIMYIKSR